VRWWIENYMNARRAIDKINTTICKALNDARVQMTMPRRQVFLQRPAVTGIGELELADA
jgi:small-conductance mechanosensitive channel